ncbi:MAG: ABC transporter substrate-binding protein [Acidimicrobiia bacterium]
MKRKNLTRGIAALCALSFIAAACGDDGGESASTTAAATETTAAAATTAAPATTAGGTATTAGGAATTLAGGTALLADNGPCDASKPKYKVGNVAPHETSTLSLIDQVKALEASVKAFNARGGIAGHCMETVICDDKMDPNQEIACAQEVVDKGAVVTLNDTTSVNPVGAIDVFLKAGMPRLGVSPSNQDLGAVGLTYAIGLGGTGTTFSMAVSCLKAGATKLAAIHVDSPTIGFLFDALKPMLTAYGAELVYKGPVAAGTTDFSQFTLAAEKAGATCTILPLGENEVVQVLNAAKQLGTKMQFTASWGSFGLGNLKALGKFGEQIIFNAEIPPIAADQTRWPILATAIKDLEASGDPDLKLDQIKSSPFRSWIAVYHLKAIIEKFGTPDVITREAVTAAIKKATNVDTFGLIPPWTPSASVTGGKGADGAPCVPLSKDSKCSFAAVSNPWYYTGKYDDTKKTWVLDNTFINTVFELGGVKDYPQPAAK